jgi:hypothetical protein
VLPNPPLPPKPPVLFLPPAPPFPLPPAPPVLPELPDCAQARTRKSGTRWMKCDPRTDVLTIERCCMFSESPNAAKFLSSSTTEQSKAIKREAGSSPALRGKVTLASAHGDHHTLLSFFPSYRSLRNRPPF